MLKSKLTKGEIITLTLPDINKKLCCMKVTSIEILIGVLGANV